LVITLFLTFGIGLLGPGVFDYETLDPLRMQVWAAAVTGAQTALLVLLTYLALNSRPSRRM